MEKIEEIIIGNIKTGIEGEVGYEEVIIEGTDKASAEIRKYIKDEIAKLPRYCLSNLSGIQENDSGLYVHIDELLKRLEGE